MLGVVDDETWVISFVQVGMSYPMKQNVFARRVDASRKCVRRDWRLV